jgi:hypothetical protein
MAERVGCSNRKQFLGNSGGSWGFPGDNERTGSGRERQEARGRRNKQSFDKCAVRGAQSRQKLFPQEGTGGFD